MKKIFLLPFLLATLTSGSYLYAQKLSDSEVEVKLSDTAIAAFRRQAISSVTDLSRYIKTIAEKNRELGNRQKAVGLAIGLFASEDNIIETSSLKEPAPVSYPVKKYFNRLLNLSYSSVAITWYKIYLSNNFIQGPDKKYYGTATIYQRFEGRYNRELEPYRDVTIKRITLTLELVNVYVGASAISDWRLKLGDIKVEETQ